MKRFTNILLALVLAVGVLCALPFAAGASGWFYYHVLGVGEKRELEKWKITELSKNADAKKYLTIDKKNNVIIGKKAGAFHFSSSGMEEFIIKPAPKKVSAKNVILGVGEKCIPTVTYSPQKAGDSYYGDSWDATFGNRPYTKTSPTFKSDDTKIATVNKTTGKITAKKIGKAKITVTTYNGKKATMTVTVKKAPTSVKLNKYSATMAAGGTLTLTATLPKGTVSKANLKWTTSDKKIATVKNGVVIAKKNAGGICTITVKTYNGKSAKCDVVVK